MDKCFKTILHFNHLESTNDYIIELYKKFHFRDTLTVVADNQTKGRGRMNKIWISDNGQGLTFSFSIKLCDRINLFDINMLTALSVVHLLIDLNISAYIKYPNDIICNNKKIAGLLIESIKVIVDRYCIVGVGVNINNDSFSKDILHATSLCEIAGKKFDKNQIFNLLIGKIKQNMKLYFEDKLQMKKTYFSVLWGYAEYVPCLFNENKIFVKIKSITKHGFLSILIKDSVSKIVHAKDIRFLLS